MEKLPSFDQNHGLTPLEKPQIFELLNFLFLYILEKKKKVFFFCLVYHETHFSSWPILPKIERFEKLSFFYQNHGLTTPLKYPDNSL